MCMNFFFRQLKEGYQNEAIPNEVPELVRVLLTQYPDALAVRRPGNLVTIIIVSIIYLYWWTHEWYNKNIAFECVKPAKGLGETNYPRVLNYHIVLMFVDNNPLCCS